ncbi:MAG: VTT domain-containing protein [Clostridia bacterium]|nr:VTT domain-containing protein [Clostridia bacterium]
MRKFGKRVNGFLFVFSVLLLTEIALSVFLDVIDGLENLTGTLKNVVYIVLLFVIAGLCCFAVITDIAAKSILKRLLLFLVFLVFLLSIALKITISSGFIYKIDNVEALREFISSFGAYSILLYMAIQFLQVAFLPIPSFVTVGAGVLLFGPFKAAVFGIIGIVLGSLFAFFVGRRLGVKTVVWLIGEKSLEKGLSFIKGKDGALLTVMFLFPFFPDDVLCFVSGLTKISAKFFAVMISIVRTITVFCACYSLNNSLIPYNTWWGILLWALYFLFTITTVYFVYKKGEIIEGKVKNLFHKKN